MTKCKSLLVSREACCEYMDHLGLSEFILIGKGVKVTNNIKAEVLEAIIGAIREGCRPFSTGDIVIEYLITEILIPIRYYLLDDYIKELALNAGHKTLTSLETLFSFLDDVKSLNIKSTLEERLSSNGGMVLEGQRYTTYAHWQIPTICLYYDNYKEFGRIISNDDMVDRFEKFVCDLSLKGIKFREDSHLSAKWILKGSLKDVQIKNPRVEDIINLMYIMNFLHTKTDYVNILNNCIETFVTETGETSIDRVNLQRLKKQSQNTALEEHIIKYPMYKNKMEEFEYLL
eukprot:TRINITY_DN6659_c0_g1_i1.p1 TRINITY_DN6659_c0_g1~~TRINITY_DN6659_c0_g1_i1.p1  ORF type:complete len:288 (+),score=29.91 TRINITY_DN6659_c0_g1_i1:352-1215(+)